MLYSERTVSHIVTAGNASESDVDRPRMDSVDRIACRECSDDFVMDGERIRRDCSGEVSVKAIQCRPVNRQLSARRGLLEISVSCEERLEIASHLCSFCDGPHGNVCNFGLSWDSGFSRYRCGPTVHGQSISILSSSCFNGRLPLIETVVSRQSSVAIAFVIWTSDHQTSSEPGDANRFLSLVGLVSGYAGLVSKKIAAK
ncbi:hypothetical protein Halxa_0320 (plasmid) [Halopiger xanaduensis SH-6]|uniref:Uncharacterized protein n=1 Tax=Halopiger xanaduensis (strain DSM 18323 / JCM 14033 / SH-6) TaxID=797210 RepID=F8DD36_HALXS|nr:hypothetical protein Halxa_0320 [Halopiger xanaduensis SH-6]